MKDGIFIYGNVPSSKNSKVWTGKLLINNSRVYRYKKQAELQFEAHRNRFLKAAEKKSLPLQVKFTFYRETQQRFDFNNISQIVCDLMVSAGWIEDDSYKLFCSCIQSGSDQLTK
jgi:Holliday junction resolvase RusA-like endonuclease